VSARDGEVREGIGIRSSFEESIRESIRDWDSPRRIRSMHIVRVSFMLSSPISGYLS
jgi:hypothetical protein